MSSSVTRVNHYRFRCTDEATDKYQWGVEEPTTCPTNSAHSIDATSLRIVDHIDKAIIQVQEEITPTGGHFQERAVSLDIPTNSTASTTFSWPYPVSALSMSYLTDAGHEGDMFSISINKNQTIGSLSADVTAPTVWSSQNYAVDALVAYTGKQYKCIVATVSNEDPTDATYWAVEPFQLSVSSTVTGNTSVGYHLTLNDGTNTDDLGPVLSIDASGGTVTTELAPSQNYAAATPTYVQQTVYYAHQIRIGPAGPHVIGESKIGGSYIPANAVTTVDFTNNSTTDAKKFVGSVEFLY